MCRRGHAEEVYHILIPRHPQAAADTVSTGRAAATEVDAAAMGGGTAAPGQPAGSEAPMIYAPAVVLPERRVTLEGAPTAKA